MRRVLDGFRGEPPLLTFGVSFALFSSFGQTFLISLFVVLMVASALMLATATHVASLGIALVGLRLAGQGLSGHTAYTVMARYSGTRRGRALSIASLGFPAGEAVLPVLTALAIPAFGWRRTWLLFAVVAVVVFLPSFLASLKRSGIEVDPRRLGTSPVEPKTAGPNATSDDWTRAAVLRDRSFRLALPAALLPSFWMTGVFLYQTRIAGIKGWSVTLIASAFVGFALSRVAFALVAGRLVDRVGARIAYPFVILPMAVALLLPLSTDAAWAAYGMMAGLVGMTVGLAEPVRSSLWAELYGVRHLGAIKAMIASFGVVGAAGSPVLIGFGLDAGVDIDHILALGIATTVAGVLLAMRMGSTD